MNLLVVLLFAPLIAGFLAWILDFKVIREVIGIAGASIPIGVLAYYYNTVTSKSITYSFTVGGFTLGFQLSMLTWYFASVASIVGVAMAFGMASTSKSSYDWLFALMSFTGVLGVFLSSDFVGFFLFWELMTFGSFMMVLRRNKHGSLKYFVLSVIGAYAMLLAIGILYARTCLLYTSPSPRD